MILYIKLGWKWRVRERTFLMFFHIKWGSCWERNLIGCVALESTETVYQNANEEADICPLNPISQALHSYSSDIHRESTIVSLIFSSAWETMSPIGLGQWSGLRCVFDKTSLVVTDGRWRKLDFFTAMELLELWYFGEKKLTILYFLSVLDRLMCWAHFSKAPVFGAIGSLIMFMACIRVLFSERFWVQAHPCACCLLQSALPVIMFCSMYGWLNEGGHWIAWQLTYIVGLICHLPNQTDCYSFHWRNSSYFEIGIKCRRGNRE